MERYTPANLGQFDELQDRIVGRVGLIASIAMPSISNVRRSVFPKVLGRFLGLVGGDDVDIRVLVSIEMGQRVNVQC